MLRRLYDWCVGIAGQPYAAWVLGAVAFADSSFFTLDLVRDYEEKKQLIGMLK